MQQYGMWALPFILFICGYVGMSHFVQSPHTKVPAVVGMRLEEAMLCLAQSNLAASLRTRYGEGDLPEHSVIEQSPPADSCLRRYQAVELLVIQKPPLPRAPALAGLTPEQVGAIKEKEELIMVEHWLPWHGLSGRCFAQSPLAHEPVADNTVHVYYAKPMTPLRIMTELVGMRVSEVIEAAALYSIDVELFHRNELPVSAVHHCTECVVCEQLPRAGALISIEKGLKIYLYAYLGGIS